MNAYRCQTAGNVLNPYTVSVEQDNKIISLKGSVAYGFRDDETLVNQTVLIGNEVIDTSGLFYNCQYFNGNVLIPNGLKSGGSMFFNCHNFNRNVQIPDSVEKCSFMFAYCTKFQQNIKLPKNAVYLDGMYYQCNVNIGNVEIPENVISTESMFYISSSGGYPHNINAYFLAKEYKYINIRNMFCTYYGNNMYRRNIFFNAVLNNVFNKTDFQSIVGGAITWTPMTNGFYNSYYNIYCFNNL